MEQLNVLKHPALKGRVRGTERSRMFARASTKPRDAPT